MCGCASSVPENNSLNSLNSTNNIINLNCGVTIELLEHWQKILFCIKNEDKTSLIYSNTVVINQYLGLIQSALNYPDNYCYYFEQIENFQNSLLPLIVNNVPECIV